MLFISPQCLVVCLVRCVVLFVCYCCSVLLLVWFLCCCWLCLCVRVSDGCFVVLCLCVLAARACFAPVFPHMCAFLRFASFLWLCFCASHCVLIVLSLLWAVFLLVLFLVVLMCVVRVFVCLVLRLWSCFSCGVAGLSLVCWCGCSRVFAFGDVFLCVLLLCSPLCLVRVCFVAFLCVCMFL